MDCAPACLKMVGEYYGIKTNMAGLRGLCNTSRLGTSVADIVYAAEQIQLLAVGFMTTLDYLVRERPLPCILHWRNNHYVVLYRAKDGKFTIGDPGHGMIVLSQEEFIAEWLGNEAKGVAILIEPKVGGGAGAAGGSDKSAAGGDGWARGGDKSAAGGARAAGGSKGGMVGGEKGEMVDGHKVVKASDGFWGEGPAENLFRQFATYLKPHLKPLSLLLLIVVLSSLLSLVIPKTIQYMTDAGVEKKKVNIIWGMLLFQFVLFGAMTVTNYIKNLVQAKLSTKLSIRIISGFLLKLIRLPISFFDTKNHGDIYQRIADHSRIETFLSTKLVGFFFSASLLLVYVVQLFWYDSYIVGSFLIMTALSFIWFFLFMKKRKELDYRRFGLAVEERYFLNDLISGMTEIKINDAQEGRIGKWHELQQKLYGFKVSNLKFLSVQQNGTNTINQLKSIFITFLCSYWVVNGKITFGVMLGIGYMVGQLTVPLQDIMLFFQDLQDARTSFERLNEIQQKANENDEGKLTLEAGSGSGFNIVNLSFKYPGIHNPFVLRGVNLFIPEGKITAIVGTSGSGKTTLMKLLLAFYQPQKGCILVGDNDLKDINTDDFRKQCGVVIQDAYIYNSSIAQNIAMADKDIDIQRVYHALEIACFDEFVRSLPLKHNTLLGNIGLDLSGGQKQRLFIARAVYKNPKIIFFDEATNSLDANNERKIMRNLERFFIGKTVLVIAHRLSTVKNAAQIIVLEKGEIAEVGTHADLVGSRGKYYELVRNQLELGR